MISNSPCSPTTYWIRDLNLKPEDRLLLQEAKQLNDRVLAAAGKVLQSQFPELPKLQPTFYVETLHKLRLAEEGSLFFHNFSNHWTVSQLSHGQVFHYDSLQAKFVASELRKQLVTLYAHTSDSTELQILQPHVQIQRGSKDCGCFAVAFAVSLLLGEDPTALTYCQNDMRQHLIRCLESGLFTPFPATEKKAKRKVPDLKLTIKL